MGWNKEGLTGCGKRPDLCSFSDKDKAANSAFCSFCLLCSPSGCPQELSEQGAGWGRGGGVQCLRSPLCFPAGRHQERRAEHGGAHRGSGRAEPPLRHDEAGGLLLRAVPEGSAPVSRGCGHHPATIHLLCPPGCREGKHKSFLSLPTGGVLEESSLAAGLEASLGTHNKSYSNFKTSPSLLWLLIFS